MLNRLLYAVAVLGLMSRRNTRWRLVPVGMKKIEIHHNQVYRLSRRRGARHMLRLPGILRRLFRRAH